MLRVVESALAVRDRAIRVARLNLELAQLELKRKARLYGAALAVGVVALVLVLYAIGFLFAAAATGIAEALPLWASLLIVAVLLLATAVLLGLLAAALVKKAGPPRPEAAVDEARRTAEELRDG